MTDSEKLRAIEVWLEKKVGRRCYCDCAGIAGCLYCRLKAKEVYAIIDGSKETKFKHVDYGYNLSVKPNGDCTVTPIGAASADTNKGEDNA